MKRKWDVSSDQTKRKCLDEIINRIKEQEDSEFGLIAAEDILNIVLQNVAPDIYSSAIKDAKKLIEDKIQDLDIELDLLKTQS